MNRNLIFGYAKALLCRKPKILSYSRNLSDQRAATTNRKLDKLPSKLPIAGVKKIILVSSAKGGVGKSLVSVNLAYAIKHNDPSKEVGILDADVFGPSLPMMTGLKGEPQLNKQNMMLPLVNYGVRCMSMGFLIDAQSPVVWRGLMVMSALQRLLRHVHWGELDVLVVDMPPGTGDTQLSIIQNVPLDGALLVTTPQQVAQSDLIRGAKMFRDLHVPILGLINNMSHYWCANCATRKPIFGPIDAGERLATKLNVQLLADLPIDPLFSSTSDAGCPIVVQDPDCDASRIFLLLANKIVRQIGV